MAWTIGGGAVVDHLRFVGGHGDAGGFREVAGVFAVPAVGDGFGEEGVKSGFEGGKLDPVLGAFGAGDAGFDGGEVEFDDGGEVERVLFLRDAEKALGAEVVLHQLDLFRGAAGAAKVGEGFRIDGEVAHGGAVFGSHVGDGGAVREGEAGGAGAEELDKLADDLVFTEKLGDGEGEVRGGGGGRELAREIEADDLRGEEGEGLAEHAGLRLDAANAPADDAEAVDHGGVGIGADEGVGIGEEGAVGLFLREDATGEVFEVYLMDDADPGRDDPEGLEGLLAPFEKLVAFPVAFELVLHVEHEGLLGAVDVDLDGVVDHQVDGDEGFDELGIALEAGDGVAHGGEVDEERDAGEVLEDDAGDGEGDFLGGGLLGVPAGEVFDIAGGGLQTVAMAEDGFQDDTEGDGEAGEVGLELGGKFGEGLKPIGRAGGGEGVERQVAEVGHGVSIVRIR